MIAKRGDLFKARACVLSDNAFGAQVMKGLGMSNVAIAQALGVTRARVRQLLLRSATRSRHESDFYEILSAGERKQRDADDRRLDALAKGFAPISSATLQEIALGQWAAFPTKQ